MLRNLAVTQRVLDKQDGVISSDSHLARDMDPDGFKPWAVHASHCTSFSLRELKYLARRLSRTRRVAFHVCACMWAQEDHALCIRNAPGLANDSLCC